MLDHTLTITDSADEALRRELSQRLGLYNTNRAGSSEGRLLVVRVDRQQQLLGGLWGATSYGWLSIQLFFLPMQLRGLGIGTKILRMAEGEARLRGCHGAWLDTYEFQARDFYQALGYEVFGELEDYPRGYRRFFMKKSLLGHG